jgi:hypothetical protein
MPIKPKIFIIFSFAASISGCASYVSEEIKVDYGKIELVQVSKKYLFEHLKDEKTKALKINLTSNINLYNYFKKEGRVIQPRCDIYIGDEKSEYDTLVYGPYYKDINITYFSNKDLEKVVSEENKKTYLYTIYALSDLVALKRSEIGESNEVSLTSIKFSKIQCYILGVTMLGYFPRTNYLTINYDDFNKIINQKP